jgi:uncharacterized protein (TIGR04255 family)
MTDNPAPLPAIAERRYRRPPLVEALCEVYFAGGHWDSTIPGLFYERVRQDFPQKSQMERVGIEVQVGAGQTETRTLPLEQRMRFAKDDNSRLLQLDRNLLVVNQLLPYPHYEQWREVVLATTEVYRQLANPAGVARVGMRYINRISFAASGIHMEQFFRVYPEVPRELGGTHGPFMLQLLMAPACSGHQLTLTLHMPQAEGPGSINILLDLYDVASHAQWHAFGDIRRLLDEAHVNIVHTFENTITDTSRTLFEEITGE